MMRAFVYRIGFTQVRAVLRHGLVSILLVAGFGVAHAQVDLEEITAVLTSFTYETVLTIYVEFDQRADALVAAIDALNTRDGLRVANLQAAQVAWKAARVPWERSEAFLYGPADTEGLHVRIDTWPVHVEALETVIDPITGPADFSQATLNALVDRYGEGVVGFHAIAYLLFVSAQGERDLADVLVDLHGAPRRVAYLVALAADLKTQSRALWLAWEPSEGNYAATFISGGVMSLREMAQGMLDMAFELLNRKLAAPSAEELESTWSGNSLTDMVNNLLGLSATYESTAELVVELGAPEADAALRAKILTAIAAIAKVPSPLRDSLILSAPDVQEAIMTVTGLHDLIEETFFVRVAARSLD